MKSLLCLLFVLGTAGAVSAQLRTVAVGEVRATPSLQEDIKAQGKATFLGRLVEALDGQFIDRLNETRKFQLLVRSDLRAALTEWDLAESGLSRPSRMPQELAEAEFLVTVVVDSFQDIEETLKQSRDTFLRRETKVSAVMKVFEVGSGKILATSNIQTSEWDTRQIIGGATASGGLLEEVLVKMARDLAQQSADRVVDVIFPAKVLSKRDRTVLINRGDGSTIAVGDVWEVFALGEELIDPDTGVSLGAEEAYIGKIRVTRIRPQFSECEILEDLGIDRGQVVRRP